MPTNPACTACSLHINARNVCVWGEKRTDGELAFSYSRQASIMLVGEAPGHSEDAAGRPFIGPAGSKLKEVLDANNITDYYITNVAKCISNGPPSSTQTSACKPYLEEEIAAVKPKFILALGNTAVHHFMKGKITEIAGKETWSEKYQCWVFPALHPAAILRDPNREAGWKADIARFGMLVRGELVEKPPVNNLLIIHKDQMRDLLVYLRTKPFTYDFETPILPWWDKTWKPLTIAFGFKDDDWLQGWTVPLGYPNSGVDVEALKWFLGEMIPIMSDPTKPKSAHNALFDDLCWYRLTGQLPYVTCDTMVLAHILDENRLKSLKYLGRALLGWPQWDIDAKKEHTLGKLAEYNAFDAGATLLLREKLLAELKKQPRLYTYFVEHEMPKLRSLERLIARGVHVDREVLCSRTLEATAMRATALQALPIENPASTPQLKTWLYNPKGSQTEITTGSSAATRKTSTIVGLGLPAPHLTPKGQPSTDEEAIKRICQRYPEHAGIRKLLEWRKWNKFLTTYLTPVGLSLDNSFDGRLHPEYRSTSVETGRLGSSFHTTPRDNFVRSIYSSSSGHSLISADYSQIEARLAAWAAAGKPASVSGQSSMLAAWYTGRDVYVEQAALILGKRPDQVTRDPSDPMNERQVMGKVPVLASLYDISAKGIQEHAWKKFEIDWTKNQAQKVWDGFHALWPEFKRWHQLMEVKIKTDGFVVSEIGRVRRLPAALYGDWKAQAEAVRSGINAPTQSIASDILQASMNLLNQHPEFERKFWIVGSIHDALLVEVEDGYLQEFLPIFKFIMVSSHLALRPMGLCLPHNLIQVEIKVGGGWGEGKEIKNIPELVRT